MGHASMQIYCLTKMLYVIAPNKACNYQHKAYEYAKLKPFEGPYMYICNPTYAR